MAEYAFTSVWLDQHERLQADRQQGSEDSECLLALQQTEELLVGRTCVTQVVMPRNVHPRSA
eukprot:3343781-Amphidinium_carterae.2